MQKMNVKDLDVKGKKVLVRVDFNVPLSENGSIADVTRIQESLPTIKHILNNNGSVVLMSHMGRPKGKVDPKFSLAPCARKLSELLRQDVIFASDCQGPEVEKKVAALKPSQVLLLENLRFYQAEEKPAEDPHFAANLAKLGDIYVNDAFGTAHRSHSSTAVIAKYFPGKAVAGLLLEKEVRALGSLLLHPQEPFYALIGGAKISSKIGVLKSLASKANAIFIGGGMSYTFMKAHGLSIGDSIHEDDQIEETKSFEQHCLHNGVKVFLPQDLKIANAFNPDALSKVVPTTEGIPEGWQGMDIGPKTISLWQNELKAARTVFWNGPLGVFEFPRFAEGTYCVAQTLASLTGCSTVVGGGDSVSAVNHKGLAHQFTHISTGGGASLEFIEYGHLPGLDALSDKK